jgi:hypothetical protein
MYVLSRHLFSYIVAVVVFCGLAFTALVAEAADLVITPASGSYNAGQTFTATIQVDPAGDRINAVEAQLSFNPATLSVVSVAKTGSVFTLWPVEPTFSNSAGTITFGGGHTAPITSRSTLLVVTFRAVAPGTAGVQFTSGSVLAADGLGTDVLDSRTGANFTVAAATTPTPTTPTDEPAVDEEDNAAIAFGDPPRAPEVGSPQFLDPETWYNFKSGIFTWELPFDVNEVAVELATSSDHTPTTTFDPPIEEFSLTTENAIDGIQYLSVQYRNQVGWGAVTNRKIQIDTIPPEPFQISIQPSNSTTGFPLLRFDATDRTSGIERYQVFIADREPFEITPDEARIGYLLGELEDGTYTVRVVAFDKAGNQTESSVPVLITAGWTAPVEVVDESSLLDLFTGINLLILFLFAVIMLLLAYIFYTHKQQVKTEEKLRKETREIQDQMEKIFSALRDEIYDQIVTITKRPRLSAKEKEAVEGLHQALEVSETLIEKEISDVKKILK